MSPSSLVSDLERARAALRTRGRREYGIGDLRQALPDLVGCWQVAKDLVDLGSALRLYRGLYWFTDGDPTSEPDAWTPYWVAAQLARGRRWCFSFETALALHGLAPDDGVLRLNVSKPLRPLSSLLGRRMVASYERNLKLNGVGGLETPAGELPVASPERALLDALALPKHAGGILGAVALVARHHARLDVGELGRIGARLGWPATLRRAGFVLERLGCDARDLRPLAPAAGAAYTSFDPSGPKAGGRCDPRWRVRLNLDEAALAAALATRG